ncbi:hypothetical protein MYAM1_000458 [Malassezia yamatoensis]|uniref:Uncharacterized protein n=1 Tax=Malassezia yamatoensis TaxID=253288 RepID=A0AAJ6CFH0_9BASI|nr:hypothetical protein MYAM1_000458 [Malassezia yamatoensis]
MAARGAPRFTSFQVGGDGGEYKDANEENGTGEVSNSERMRDSKTSHASSRQHKRHEHAHRERHVHHHSSASRARRDTDLIKHHRHGTKKGSDPQERLKDPVPIYVIDRFGDTEGAKYKYQRNTTAKPSKKESLKRLKSIPGSGTLETSPLPDSAAQSTPAVDQAADFLPLESFEEQTVDKDYNDLYQRVRKSHPTVSQENVPVFSEGSVQDLSRSLHREVSLDPTNLSAWFKLAKLQSRIIQTDPNKEATHLEEANCARMQIAVLERAEDACERNHNCLPLVLARLRICSEAGIRSSNELLHIWSRELRDHASLENISFLDMSQLYWAYVQFRKGDWASFTVDSFWEVCCEALQMPAKLTTLRDKEPEKMHTFRISIIKELCVVLRSAGYCERAYGLLQALLELHLRALNQEKQSELSCQQVWDDLSIWWDAEHARIGEPLPYTGFTTGTELDTQNQLKFYLQDLAIPSSTNTGSDENNQFMDPISWHHEELRAAHGSRYPRKLRETSTTQLHDPFAFVFFEDIRKALYIPETDDPWSAIGIADVYFELLGLPSRWCSACLQFGLFDFTEPVLVRSYPQLWPEDGMSKLPAKFWSDALWLDPSCDDRITVQTVALTSDTLFPSTVSDPRGIWFATLQKIPFEEATRNEPLLVHLGQRLLKLGQRNLSIKMAIPHAILCVASGQPSHARKVLRAALQQDDQNLLLWYAYAQLELNIWGNAASVRKILVQVLGFGAPRNNSVDRYAMSLLWSLWVEMEWSLHEENRCLYILANAAKCELNSAKELSTLQLQHDTFTESPLRSTDKLKLRKTFQELIGRSLQITETLEVLPGLVVCAAIAELLIQDVPVGDEMMKPSAIFHRGIKTKNRKLQSEVAMKFQRFLQMVSHVKPHTPSRLRELRANTVSLLQLDRWNSCHLQMLALREQHSKVDGYVQEVLRSDVLNDHRYGSALDYSDDSTEASVRYEDAEQAWLLAIAARIHTRCNLDDLLPMLKASIHAMRRSSVLWHVIINRELQRLSNPSTLRLRERTKAYQSAKALIYQAIHSCPYDKALFLLAFDPRLEPIFDANELYALARMMEEKQLRIFHDLAEPVPRYPIQVTEPSDETQLALDRISSFLHDVQASASTS